MIGERILRTDVTLAQRLAAAQATVSDLEQRLRTCPHDWAEVGRTTETYYVKGIRPDGTAYPPMHMLVVTSTCTRCGTTRTFEEKVDG